MHIISDYLLKTPDWLWSAIYCEIILWLFIIKQNKQRCWYYVIEKKKLKPKSSCLLPVSPRTTKRKWIILNVTSEVGLPRMAFRLRSALRLFPSGISGCSVKSPPRFIPALFGDSRKMAAVPLYCVCRQPYDVNRFMIECDICKDWFHGR